MKTIPDTLLDDLLKARAIYEEPTCACFFAIDAALPSQAARVHLNYLAYKGDLVSIDAREYARENPAWVSSVLRTRDEAQRLMAFSGPLLVYVSPDHALRETFHDGLSCLMSELSFMLNIWDRVIHRDPVRLGWIFRAAVAALRKPTKADELLEQGTDCGRNPIGRIGCLLEAGGEHLSGSSLRYLRSVRDGVEHQFEKYRAFLTTQLRLVFHLALAIAENGPWRDRFAQRLSPEQRRRAFRYATPDERGELLQRLADFLTEGLESPGDERPARMRLLLGTDDYDTTQGDTFAEGDDLWVRWASRNGAAKDFVAKVLTEMNPDHHRLDDILALAKEVTPVGVLESRLREIRGSWATSVHLGHRQFAF